MSSDPQNKATTKDDIVILNVGLMLSGDLARPTLNADNILVAEGCIAAVGKASDLGVEGATSVIDARGCGLRQQAHQFVT